MYKGVPQNDVGSFTDVIDNVPKPVGISMLIRSMAPQIIACDEAELKEFLHHMLQTLQKFFKTNI